MITWLPCSTRCYLLCAFKKDHILICMGSTTLSNQLFKSIIFNYQNILWFLVSKDIFCLLLLMGIPYWRIQWPKSCRLKCYGQRNILHFNWYTLYTNKEKRNVCLYTIPDFNTQIIMTMQVGKRNHLKFIKQLKTHKVKCNFCCTFSLINILLQLHNIRYSGS